MTLTEPAHPAQNQFMAMDWDSDQFSATPADFGYTVTIKGEGKFDDWYMTADPKKNWLLYLERNSMHAFYAADPKNQQLKDTGWVSIWARTTAQDNEQSTRISKPVDPATERILPDTPVTADARNWKP